MFGCRSNMHAIVGTVASEGTPQPSATAICLTAFEAVGYLEWVILKRPDPRHVNPGKRSVYVVRRKLKKGSCPNRRVFRVVP
jgi:hypothetical protein